jgi:hypothetical protein
MGTLFQVHSVLLAYLLPPVAVGAAGTARKPSWGISNSER